MIEMKPMLAESADDRRANTLLTNDEWIAQQKVDGHRVLVTVEDGNVTCLNRQGKPKSTMITPPMVKEFARFHIGEWVFDGELVDGIFWLFDMPIAGTHVDPSQPLAWRLDVLDGLYSQVLDGSTVVRLLPKVEGAAAKRLLLNRLRNECAEGLMFKNLNGKYESGRRSRHLLKYKFVNTIDCVVTAVNSNGKENLTLALYDDNGRLVEIGDCTGRAGDTSAAFKVGDVAEVKYLYMGAGGRLYQPTYPILRTDKDQFECTFDQVVHVNKKVMV